MSLARSLDDPGMPLLLDVSTQNRSNISNQNLSNTQRSRRVFEGNISYPRNNMSCHQRNLINSGEYRSSIGSPSCLCHRLVTVLNTRKQQQDDVSTHLAKIMLEKNFVATLTNALSVVDLNYPNVRNLVSVLHTCEF